MQEKPMPRTAAVKASALALALSLPLVPAHAQGAGEQMQLCVNQCLYHFGPASNPRYHACVAEQCEGTGPAPQRQQPAQPPRQGAAWTTGAVDGGRTHYARVQSGRLALSYMCQRGSEGLIAVEGMAGSPGSLALRIDGKRVAQPFATSGGMRATQAARGSALLAGLLGGSRVELSDDRGRGSLPLAGSGRAIRTAMAACGLRP
jgi:hypothetical protein